ncbi:ABC transporter substrate-binding protein [Haladaptatus pallidirubidus]|uniref:Solute-binding protein family 5 domain-containing protein n=1 Tax=Haladaptatus pallidirubidus TaxID=1008152 RepID=A0AAV3UBL5_9EURY|nr:ABC transporter substrate-binding protein [Haladaptatus pallidirubidus]
MPRRRNRSGTDESRRNFLKVSGAGAVALSLAGCSGNNDDPEGTGTSGDDGTTEGVNTVNVDPENITPGGTLRYGLPEAPDSPSIILASSVYSAVGLSPVYNYGVSQDPVTFEVKPSVFTDWELQNGDSEKPDIYFNARSDGLEWNDGESFKTEDILFSYQFMLDNEPGEFSVWNDYEKIEEASNDWDFHIKLSRQVGVWDSKVLGYVPMLPKHKWEDVDYQNYNPMDENEEGPVGTGPGKLVQYNPDTSMQVKFRRDYIENTYALNDLDWIKEHQSLLHGGPFLDGVNFKVYGGIAPMTQAFMNGDIDTHYGTLDVSSIPKAQNQDGLGLVKGFDSGFAYYGFNLRRQPLDDVAFRQAMAFMWDEQFWVKSLKGDFVIKGDYAQSPGYKGVRPETVFGGELLTAPETEAFNFRGVEGQGKKPDVEGVRKFLTDGQVISKSGTYAGQEFPGTFSGVEASQSEAKYNYTFESVQSQALKDADVEVDKEIRIDGQTVPEMMDGDAITIFIDPPSEQPDEAEAIQQWAGNLHRIGIPVRTEPIAFNTMSGKVYNEEDFDVYPMGWGGTSAYGISLHSFFHSENAGDDTEQFAYNSTGYGVGDSGADDLLSDAYSETDPEERAKKFARAMEKIYLDMPYMLRDYEKYRWPMNTAKFGGFVENIVDPAYANWSTEYGNMFLNDNLKE